jgi:hypothetical protein
MEDKLFYFPQSPGDVLWKDVKSSVQTQTTEWSVKKDVSDVRVDTLNLNNVHKLYVTLIGGGGSGSLGEKRPKNNTAEYARDNNSYTAYTNMCPLPGCGGGGAATIFRIPIILIQSHQTFVDYTVGSGGEGTFDVSSTPIKSWQERVGKNGEDTSVIIRQQNSQNVETKVFKIKAIGGGGGGVVGYTHSRESIYNMTSASVAHIWDWSFGMEHRIDDIAVQYVNEAQYYNPNEYGEGRHQWWNIRHGDDPDDLNYFQYTHFNRLAENWTAITKLPVYSHIAFHRELEFPIGRDLNSESAANRNEYIPYNFLTHGEHGISRMEYLKPYDKITLPDFSANPERYFGGGFAQSDPGSAIYNALVDLTGDFKKFPKTTPTSTYYGFLWQYAGDKHYKDDREWVQIWDYNVDRLQNHPRYYLRTGNTYLCKDRGADFPKDNYLPSMTPSRQKITLFANGKEDIVLNRWSQEFTSLMQHYGGPIKKIPQPKGTTGAFGGAGGGFLHYDDPTPLRLHGLYGGQSMYNVWKIPESGRGGNPYPKKITNTINVRQLDASGLEGAYHYWGGDGYEDADSRGANSKMTTFFIPGSGGGSLDYVHQNKRISRRKYTGQEVDFKDIYPAFSESPYTNIDDRVFKWFAEHYEELATGGKITYEGRDPSNNAYISRLYMNDLYGTHKINFLNRGETGERPTTDLLMIFGAGGGGGRAFYYTPGNGQENPDMEPNFPGYGCGSGGSCSLNVDGEAAIIGLPTGSVDFYLRKMIEYNESRLYINFHNSARSRIDGALAGVVLAVIVLNIVIAVVSKLLPGVFESIQAAAIAGKAAGKGASVGQKIARVIMKIVKWVKKAYKWVSKKLKTVRQYLQAAFYKLYSGGSFADNLAYIKETDKLEKLAKIADAAAESAKLLQLAESGQKWKYHLKKIPSKLLSFVTGDIGDTFVDSFDDIVIETQEIGGKSVKIAKIQNKIFQAVFGKIMKKITPILDAAKLAKQSKKAARKAEKIAKFGKISEGVSDVGRDFGKVFNKADNIDNIAKNADAVKSVDQAKAASNLVENSTDQAKMQKAYDDMKDGIQKALAENGGKGKPSAFDVKKSLEDSGLNQLEQQKVMNRLSEDMLNNPTKKVFNNVTDDNRKVFESFHNDVDKLSLGLDKQVASTNPLQAIDITEVEVIMKPRGDPEALEDSAKILTPEQRTAFFDYYNKNYTKLDPNSKMNMENLAELMGDQTQVLKYKIVPNSNTLEFMRTVQGQVDKTLDFASGLKVNDELVKIFNDFPGVKNLAKNGQPASKAMLVSNAFNKGDNMIKFMNQNPDMMDEFVDMFKKGDFSKKVNANANNFVPIANAPIARTYDSKELKKFLNKATKNAEFKKVIATNPAKLEELKSLMKMSDTDFANAKLFVFGKLSGEPDTIPHLLKNMTPDELKKIKTTFANDDVMKHPFFSNVRNYLDGQKQKGIANVVDGKVRLVIDGDDVTGVMDEFYDLKKANLEKKLNDPNALVIEDLDMVDEFDNTLRYNEKKLGDVGEKKLRDAGFDLDGAKRADSDGLNNLYDNVKATDLQNKISNHQKILDDNFTNATNQLDRANPNYTAQYNKLNDAYQANKKNLDDVWKQLEEYKNAPASQKKFVDRPPRPVPELGKTELDFKNMGLDDVKQKDIDNLADARNGANQDALDAMKNKVDNRKAQLESEIAQKKTELADIQQKNKDIDLRNDAKLKEYEQTRLAGDAEYQKKMKEFETNQVEIDKAKAELEEGKKINAELDEIKAKNDEQIKEFEKQHPGLTIHRNDNGDVLYQQGLDYNYQVGDEYKRVKNGKLPELKFKNKELNINGKKVEILDTYAIYDGKKIPIENGKVKIDGKNYDVWSNSKFNKQGKRTNIISLDNNVNNPNNFTNLTLETGVIQPSSVVATNGFNQQRAVVAKNDMKSLLAKLNLELTPSPRPRVNTQALEDKIKVLELNKPIAPDFGPFKPESRIPEIEIPKQDPIDVLNDTSKRLDEMKKYSGLNNYKPTPPTPPKAFTPKKPPLESTINLSPVPLQGTQYVDPPVPENNYEYLFQVISDPDVARPPPVKKPKNLIENPIPPMQKRGSMNPDMLVGKGYVKSELMIKWVSMNINTLIFRLGYRVIRTLNKLFNTNEFSKFRTIKYEDLSDNGEIEPSIMLSPAVEPYNYIKTCAQDVLGKKSKIDDTRLYVYQEIFMDIFEYPIKIQKSEIDNELIALLMEQRRRGIAIDLEYVRETIDYNNLSIYNKLNYQYLFDDFHKVQGLLFGQINTIRKNHMVFV